ncbi:hypothetical protein U1Q18_001518 [Sarracenia purpurea var. burkii]
MIVGHWPSLHAPPQPTELCGKSRKWLYSSLRKEAYLTSSLPKPEFGPKFPIKCSCNEEERTAKSSEDFSVLGSDIPWDSGSVWSTFAFYLFTLHVPLSFGGLSVVAHVLHQPILDPQAEVINLCILMIYLVNNVESIVQK